MLASVLIFAGLAAGAAIALGAAFGRRDPAVLAGGLLLGAAALVGLAAGTPALDRIPRGRADLPAFAGLVLAVAWMSLPVGLAAAAQLRRGGNAAALLHRAALGGPLWAAIGLASVWVASFHTSSTLPAVTVWGLGFALAVALGIALARWSGRSPLPALMVSTAILALAAATTVAFVGRGIDGLAADRAKAPADMPSVILVSVDTLRADALSVYGGHTATPAFERLADDGVVFETARAPSPWTKPSSVALVTGLAPWAHGAVRRFDRIPGEIETLAERLRDGGLITGAVVSNHYLGPAYAFHQGFDTYEAFPRASFGGSWGAKFARRLFGRTWHEEASSSDLTNRAIRWVRSQAGSPFFLWLHYFDPHVPYEPPADLLPERDPPAGMGPVFDEQWALRTGHLSPDAEQRRWIRDLYDAEVRYVDRELGRFLNELVSLGLYDESLLVLTSDHGEEFWEHGSFEHGHSVFDEVLRVPLIVKLPHSSHTGRVSKPVAMTSVAPTVVDWLGLPFSPERFSAPSLRPSLDPGTQPRPGGFPPWVASDLLYYENRSALLVDGFKYLRHEVSGDEALYDLTHDPKELHNVVREYPELAERGRARLAELRARALAERYDAGNEVIPDEETLRRLRELGYVQ